MIKTKELADKLGVHINTIYNYIKRGMPYIRATRTYFFDYEDVINWLKGDK